MNDEEERRRFGPLNHIRAVGYGVATAGLLTAAITATAMIADPMPGHWRGVLISTSAVLLVIGTMTVILQAIGRVVIRAVIRAVPLTAEQAAMILAMHRELSEAAERNDALLRRVVARQDMIGRMVGELLEIVQAMAKDSAASYVDMINAIEQDRNGHNGLRVVRDPERAGRTWSDER